MFEGEKEKKEIIVKGRILLDLFVYVYDLMIVLVLNI